MYCLDPENIENFEKAKADNFVGWEVHHRLETWTSDGERRLVDITPAELKALDMYYNVPAEQLIYLTKSEHTKLHKKGNKYRLGMSNSLEHRAKISETLKGRYEGEKNPFYGKQHSEETKQKIGEKSKGRQTMLGKHHSIESKKRMSAAHKNRSEEHKKKISEAQKGKHWYNNGETEKFCYECPEGFVIGRLLIK